VSRVRENLTHGSMGGRKPNASRPTPHGASASRLPDLDYQFRGPARERELRRRSSRVTGEYGITADLLATETAGMLASPAREVRSAKTRSGPQHASGGSGALIGTLQASLRLARPGRAVPGSAPRLATGESRPRYLTKCREVGEAIDRTGCGHQRNWGDQGRLGHGEQQPHLLPPRPRTVEFHVGRRAPHP
jgi:hypothetical protein